MNIVISISSKLGELLRQRATARGQDVGQFASELVEHALSAPPAAESEHTSRTTTARVQSWEAFVAGMRDWGRTLPPGHSIDDTRDSIYAGRGE